MHPLGSFTIRTKLTLWYSGALLIILLVISALSYSLLRRSLFQDLDASLLTVAQVVLDASSGTSEFTFSPESEAALRDILGPEFYDKFFQLVDPHGNPGPLPPHLRNDSLPLSPHARDNAARGKRTFETVQLSPREPIRLLTMPIIHDGRLKQIVQIGMSLDRAERALRRYLETLLLLIPLGVGLAAIGGAVIARTALRSVDEMSHRARQITAEGLGQRIAERGTGDELDHLAETLNGMLARLEVAFREMRRFTADAAHELRTPLTALKGGIEVALRADRPAQEYRQALASSLEDVERLTRLSEDLLLLSRSENGLDAVRPKVDLEALLLEVMDVSSRLAHGTGVSIRLSEVTPVTGQGDAVALRRAIQNLVDNAVKYTPAGGKVELSLTREDGDAVIAVQDTGIGIDPSDADRIFEPFVRLDAARSRDTGGAGLGLSIARSIIIAHAGTLSLESTPGAGSRFIIRLPLA